MIVGSLLRSWLARGAVLSPRCLWILLCIAVPAYAQTDGIFADFTTSMGSFTCRLDYAIAPKAVANFIGLTTGEQAWLDEVTGRVRTNSFHEGLTFHRVIPDFMIQGGSRNGAGTDGPGYAFTDEFSASARFTSFGKLAMANSGLDSNGAQFFITVAPTTWLNDKHTIFGSLVSGSNVVYAISLVQTGAGNKPLTNVVIQKVAIRRAGSAAQAFSVKAQNLPVVSNVPLALAQTGNPANAVSLTFSNRPFAENRLYSSTNLAGWSVERLGIEGSVATNSLVRTMDVPHKFYALAQTRYSSATLSPKTLLGKQLVQNLTGFGTMTNSFDMQGGGTYAFSPYSGNMVRNGWTQEPYNYGRFWFESVELVAMDFRLKFTSATGGTLTGTAYTFPNATPLSGTFTLR
jgi:peptidyl-prolyl cis-trans isomerase A (cyclophilin A)